ncbi:hypothetical protein CBE01nite_16750 [Clostridium beijerinckii]|uniref:Uncharacterized protein n=1 Tax=Clostridium beijerinckii TaxID=1520 RepID=A0AB74VEX5_CLOBE|nr:hypothetical protein [Clostridium beijerinckii]NRZ29269.1 hypothetical protein [Clostridium beijerinckii]QUN34910.1 hypothetical protein KEC93_23800 [Clostridium beijerinckii]GEP63907.1 hypothetical protein CBE01nite_16750 [Clostridium beijerinckii]
MLNTSLYKGIVSNGLLAHVVSMKYQYTMYIEDNNTTKRAINPFVIGSNKTP